MRRMLVGAMIVASGLAAGCGADPVEDVAAPTTTSDEGAEGNNSSTAGTSMESMCVETYSLDALMKRDFAFDGTVKSIEPAAADGSDTVVFTVTKWFKGGDGPTATRQGSFSGATSVGGAERRVGDRLLVAGDDDFAWDCGFTQSYDAEIAADWSSTLSD